MPTYGDQVIIALRSYARHTATDLTVKVVGLGSVALTIEGLRLLASSVAIAWSAFRRLPDAIQLLLGVSLVAALMHKQARVRLLAFAQSLGTSALEAVGAALELADSSLSASKEGLARTPVNAYSNRRPRALIDFLVVSASEAASGLSVHDFERQVRKGGYESRSKNLASYIRRVLAQDERFVRLPDNRWALAPAPVLGWET